MTKEILAWSVFISIIFSLLIIDLGIINKKDEVITLKKSLYLSLFYIAIACLFGLFILYEFGIDAASEYYTGFLLEKIMSLDNIFMISMIFHFLKIPVKYQHRVLFWGILGVIIFRAIMIYAGAVLLQKFEWILFIFAIVIIFTGLRTLFVVNKPVKNVNQMILYSWLNDHLNLHPKIEGNKFIIKKNGKWFFTPLFMALITIESIDLIFAIDSIPAIFSITQNTFIVYSSNIFAILGLRALFFCLVNIVKKFQYIKYSLAIILILIGVKILLSSYINIPKIIPLIITILLILAGILASIIKQKISHNKIRF